MNYMISIFKALSDRNRLRIIAALSRYETLCACQITELLQITGATTSRHLSILVNVGLLDSRKEGRWVYYRLKASPENLSTIMEWIMFEFAKSADIKNDLKALKRIMACPPEELCRKQRGEACCPAN